MLNFTETIDIMKQRGVENMTPLEYSFALMIAVGIDRTQAYMATIKGKEYEKKNQEQLLRFKEKCEKDACDMFENPDIKKIISVLSEDYQKAIKYEALSLDEVDFNSEDLRKILAKFLKEKYKDIDAADAKDLLNAIKIYVDKFGDTGDDGMVKFNKHFIQVYPPYNAVCPNCGREIDLPRGVNSKCKYCEHQFIWNEDKERYYI